MSRHPTVTAYAALLAAGIEMDNHESDLYVKDSPEARKILKEHGKSANPFRSSVDGLMWLDVPFSFDPWWQARGMGVG